MPSVPTLLRRILVLILGIGLVSLGVMVFAQLAGRNVVPLALSHGGASLSLEGFDPMAWLPHAAISTVVGVLLTGLAIWPNRRAGSLRITLPSTISEDGLTVRVSKHTMESLIRYEAGQIKGVRSVAPDVRIVDAGWHVGCQLVVWRGVSMREVADEVTDRLREALHRHTGVNLSDLQIDVSLVQEPASRTQ